MINNGKAPQQTTPNTTYPQRNYTVNDVINQAEGQWPFILERLGIDSSYLKKKHGPCPICGGEDRFRFDDKKRSGSFFCNNCGAGYGIKLLELFHKWKFIQAIDAVAEILRMNTGSSYSADPIHISNHLNRALENSGLSNLAKENIEKQRKKLQKMWDQARSVTSNDLVDRYLKSRSVAPKYFPTVLRFHPQVAYYNEDGVFLGNFPAMLALVQDKNNKLITLHRTYLGDGCKANVPQPKKLMTAIFEGASKGAAIQLYQPIDGKIALAEGIETALAFHMATEMPVWATVSANGMQNIILPDNITEVIIAIDNDLSGTGQKVGDKLSRRLLSEGRIVTCVMPPKAGYDFADLLAEENQ